MESKNNSRYIQIGLRIAYYCKLNKLTQEQLAELAGMSPTYLSQVETASFVRPISLKTLFALSDSLHVLPFKLLEFYIP